ALTTNVTTSSNNTGDGEAVMLSSTGDVEIMGDEAYGLFAQSLGGGGGLVDGGFVGTSGGAGQGGQVTLTSDGDVLMRGSDGVAIMAQSAGASGGDDIAVSVNGVVMGGTDAASTSAAIMVDGGDQNTIDISGQSTLFSQNDRTVLGGDGDETMTVLGVIHGDVDLGTGLNTLIIDQQGTLRSLDKVFLGDTGTIINNGVFNPGAQVVATPVGGNGLATEGAFQVGSDSRSFTRNEAETSGVTGSLQVGATSLFILDAAYRVSGAAGDGGDLVTVSQAAEINGEVIPTLITYERALPLVFIDPVTASADLGAIVQDTAAVDFRVSLNGSTGDGTSIDLLALPAFAQPGMNQNQTNVSNHINNVLLGAGSASLGGLFAYIGSLTSSDEVTATIDRLTVEGHAANRLEVLTTSLAFHDTMEQCEHRTPASAKRGDRECAWLSTTATDYERSGGFEFKPLSSDETILQGGVKARYDAMWSYVISGAYTRTNLQSGERFVSDGARVQVGGGATRTQGATTLGFFGSLSTGEFDSTRDIGIAGGTTASNTFTFDTATSSERIDQLGLRVSVAQELMPAHPVMSLKGRFAVDANYVLSRGASEKGAGAAGANLASSGEWVVSASPSLELSAKVAGANGGTISPYLRTGLTLHSTDTMSVAASLNGSPSSAPDFINRTGFDDVTGNVGLGLVVGNPIQGWRAELGYEGEYGDTSTHHAATISLGYQF
ncbi:MAG: hypothetical protein AAGA78_01445, partial [Pseudomonadota bacterium]